MSTLVAVEVRRLLARRLVRVIALLALLGIAVGATIVFLRSEAPSAAQRERIAGQRQQSIESCIEDLSPEIGEERARVECEQATVAADRSFDVLELREVAAGGSGLLVMFGWIVGASAIGAEWQAGTMTTLLTWESRRVRLLLAKVLACAGVVFAGAILLQLVLGGALLPSALWRGSTRGVDANWLREVAGIVVRAGVIASIAAVLGFSLASVARHTAAGLGIAFALSAVIEPLLGAWRPNWQRWFLTQNMSLFVTGQDPGFPPVDRGLWRPGLVLAVYGLLALCAAALVFRRRDVT